MSALSSPRALIPATSTGGDSSSPSLPVVFSNSDADATHGKAGDRAVPQDRAARSFKPSGGYPLNRLRLALQIACLVAATLTIGHITAKALANAALEHVNAITEGSLQ